ncbi:MAG: VIT domain-containing protein, partial [Planctomycetales bacterium]
MLLKPGDLIRTDTRGANAVTLQLAGQGEVIAGPGTIVELVSASQLRVSQGQLKVTPDKGKVFGLLGPGDEKLEITETTMVRIDQRTGKLARFKQEPPWLAGYQGTVAHDSIGSLVATIDGRNVPLTVGDHKVTVDIRDQIARTTIEESFVNHTRSRLEGVFYFPLPQDASISGFGMWIGGELIEADVVEKQRAREIYETILRERRDPALLEWAGGNLFKARVFPIEGLSEKRIKITYTQVLPLASGRFRYSYALQSEMLQQHPLRNLKIDVKVSSQLPIKKIYSPTHTTRDEATQNSGHVEFAAQEYTPQRDFEVVVELGKRQSDVVVIPHRRGDDGYFMLQLIPPDGGGQWRRDLVPDGEPLQLLVLADTSASMDSDARKKQHQVIAALCASLGVNDTINIAACDVDCHWLFDGPRPVDEKTVGKALGFVRQRISLGWSNLDAAFDAVIQQSGPNTHVIYIGDGTVTTTKSDPVAFAQRLKEDYRRQDRGGAFHAISVSSTYEPIAMKAIASLGGGSFRRVAGDQGPQQLVKQLLSEIAQPAIRDLRVEFRNLAVAAVYPRELPNLVAGSQQIVLGRYLPAGNDQQGEVIVTGLQNGKPIRFSTKIQLQDAEKGNSFIPRLWARMHLDQLLDQGTSQAIRDEIIELSEKFHIITPYTSLLVLESDADRERFKVKRRFLMRDGERFFAEGRDQADYELIQKQMRLAAGWRIGLRRNVLRQLAGLGRDETVIRGLLQTVYPLRDLNMITSGGALGWVSSGHKTRLNTIHSSLRQSSSETFWDSDNEKDGQSRWSSISGPASGTGFEFLQDEGKELSADKPMPAEPNAVGLPMGEDLDGDGYFRIEESIVGSRGGTAEKSLGDFKKSKQEAGKFNSRMSGRLLGGFGGGKGIFFSDYRGGFDEYGARSRSGRYGQGEFYGRYYVDWLGQLFPAVIAPPAKAQPKETDWPNEAVELARRLLRIEQVRAFEGGVEIARQVDSFDVRREKLASVSRTLDIASSRRWFVRTGFDGGQTTIRWCNENQSGIASASYQLGRVRKSTPRDLAAIPFQLSDNSLVS